MSFWSDGYDGRSSPVTPERALLELLAQCRRSRIDELFGAAGMRTLGLDDWVHSTYRCLCLRPGDPRSLTAQCGSLRGGHYRRSVKRVDFPMTAGEYRRGKWTLVARVGLVMISSTR